MKIKYSYYICKCGKKLYRFPIRVNVRTVDE